MSVEFADSVVFEDGSSSSSSGGGETVRDAANVGLVVRDLWSRERRRRVLSF